MDSTGTDASDARGDLRAYLERALGGAYALGRELGRGGMATVYLAEDLKHRRRVALKVLHAELSTALGPERFLREIELTASLQHPHILPLFDSGSAAGRLYYVMPYVEGESLRDRLARERQLPVGDAVRIACDVAAALDYAHRRGVVHRDVKPENVLLHDGRALVADFGVARAVQRAAGGDALTGTGVAVGTPQYMSPEQAAGERDLDARSDVFSLGVVLYEALAGAPPFAAPTAQGVVAKVLAEEPPPLGRARRAVPPHVEAAVMRALEKVPADRFATAAQFAAALDAQPGAAPGQATPAAGAVAARPGLRPRRRDVAWAALVVVAAGMAAWGWLRDSGEPPRGPSRLALQLPGHQAGIAVQALALSPDGRTVVYVGAGGTGPLFFVRRLYVRRLDAPAVRPLPGTEGAFAPAVSPDGRWVAFLAEGRLKKVPLDGGAPVVLADVPDFGTVPTLSWGGDAIVFEGRGSSLYRVPAEGGRPEPFLAPDSADAGAAYTAPEWLPGGRAALVTVWRDSGARGVAAVPLDPRGATGAVRLLVRDAVSPRYVAGHLLYATLDGAVFRAPFDPTALRLTGPPAPVLAGVAINRRTAQLAVSETGTLVYRPDSLGANGLAVISRDGAVRPLPLPGAPRQRYVFAPRFSPDGRRVAVPLSTRGAGNLASATIWVLDVEDSTFTRVGGGPGAPEWMPDGRRISYPATAPEGGRYQFYAIRADGGEPEPLPTPALRGLPQYYSWGPHGRWLVVSEGSGSSVYSSGPLDLRRVDLPDGRNGGGAARPVVATPADERAPAVSPDGRWLAYISDETGRYEVYVRALDASGGRWQVSAGGGLEPRWARDGTELYYRAGAHLLAARIRTTPTFAVASRTPLFQLADPPSVFGPNYDVHPDGRSVVARWRGASDDVAVVLDWFAEWGDGRAGR